MQALIQSHRTSRVGRLGHFCNNIMLFLLHIRGHKPLLVFYFRVEVKFAGGKFREIPFGMDIIFNSVHSHFGTCHIGTCTIRDYTTALFHFKLLCTGSSHGPSANSALIR